MNQIAFIIILFTGFTMLVMLFGVILQALSEIRGGRKRGRQNEMLEAIAKSDYKRTPDV